MVPRRPHEGRGVVAVFRNAAVRAAEDGLDGVDGARGREQSAVDGKLVQVDRVVPPPELAQLRPQLMTLRRRRVGVRRNDEPATAPQLEGCGDELLVVAPPQLKPARAPRPQQRALLDEAAARQLRVRHRDALGALRVVRGCVLVARHLRRVGEADAPVRAALEVRRARLDHVGEPVHVVVVVVVCVEVAVVVVVVVVGVHVCFPSQLL
mmetsp:Transcript_24086/g.81173  ORF Transcript_24086/g.81173 Transcript_24086/m.81173 type:complete len:209 (-) Transcript_24086:1390-2016(-)